jgi:hypothetical protein
VLLRGVDTKPRFFDPSIHAVRRAGPRKVRTLWRLPSSPQSSFGVHNNNLGNVYRGVSERILNEEVDGQWIPVRQPHPDFVHRRLRRFAALVDECASPTTPMNIRDFPMLYEGRKRTTYQQAVESLLSCGLTRKDARLRTFCKCEKTNFSLKRDPAPRIIQPRDPRYNVAIGVFLKPLEHDIYAAINSVFGYTAVMKGLNALDQARAIRASWDAVEDVVAIDLDASRWDRHVSPGMLQWEHRRYLRWFRGASHDRLSQYLSWQLNNDCVAYVEDGVIKFKVRGRRSSGDMNTAMGNVLLMCALVSEFCHDLGILNYRLVNNGDDSVLLVPRRLVPLVQQHLAPWFLEMGFLMKMGPVVDVFERLSFCQTQPVLSSRGWIMCRDPRTVLAKDSVSIVPLPGPAAHKWATAVSDCGLALAGDLPVFGEFYGSLARFGGGVRGFIDAPQLETGMIHLSRGLKRPASVVSDDSRVSFYLAFGIDSTSQRIIEQRYGALSWSNSVEALPVGTDPLSSKYRRLHTQELPCV